MHVATTTRRYKGKEYSTHLVRRTFREGGKVKHETVANLTGLPPDVVKVVARMLGGSRFVEAGGDFEIERSLAHGHVVAVLGTMRRLGMRDLLCSRPSRQRTLVEAMIAARIVRAGSKLGTTRWWGDTTLPAELRLEGYSEDDLYQAMDWLLERQGSIQRKLAARRLRDGELVFYDLSSSYFEGRKCPLAKLDHSRDGKKGKLQVEYGMLTDADGCPVAVEVFEGNTADTVTVMSQVEKLRQEFGVKEFVLVGDRGMVTKTRIDELRPLGGIRWITALKSGAIQQLYRQGAIQKSLFDQRNLAEIEHPDYPGERLVVCRNPFLAAERTRKREQLLTATEGQLEKIAQRVRSGRLSGADKIGVAVGRVVNKFKVAKHFDLAVARKSFSFSRKTAAIEAEAALDGICVIRTSVPKSLSADNAVRAYKRLANVEHAFRCLKTVDLEIGPIFHRLSDRVRAQILLSMLAYHVEWHMRRALAPMLFEEEDLAAERANRDPVAPAMKSVRASKKAKLRRDENGEPIHSFSTLIEHLGSLRREVCRCKELPDGPRFTKTTLSTPTQRHALELLGVCT